MRKRFVIVFLDNSTPPPPHPRSESRAGAHDGQVPARETVPQASATTGSSCQLPVISSQSSVLSQFGIRAFPELRTDDCQLKTAPDPTRGNAGDFSLVLFFVPGIDLKDFSPGVIACALLFGLIGFAAFRWGKKNGEPRQLFLGVALMAYGYFVSNAWLSLGIGAVLTLLLFFPR